MLTRGRRGTCTAGVIRGRGAGETRGRHGRALTTAKRVGFSAGVKACSAGERQLPHDQCPMCGCAGSRRLDPTAACACPYPDGPAGATLAAGRAMSTLIRADEVPAADRLDFVRELTAA